ncbi:hypothetical protein M501DRAFT_933170 [Patellaria atrata CBS 101060]|uniref:SGNH hydrolase-type esterase domain-containing protein n=1 Tax=Patellaria atrata CBS 101060 TaxID=1346257 RepID=A0A9P4SCB6_9PEZI|nr:hypothetical protein M501DRAFT_933170 [Patellaria atrata CBS 101060]
MRFSSLLLAAFASLASATIIENGRPRDVHFPDTSITSISGNDSSWKSYGPNATEISYKGRWDSKYISWWSAPGIKFGYTGDKIALSFGQHTSPGTLIGYRIDGQDWLFTNVTGGKTHLLVTKNTPGFNLTLPGQRPRTFEMRVTNWSYGVQLTGVHLNSNGKLIKIPNKPKTIEIIGDSISAGMFNTYEGLSSWAWGVGNAFDAEFSITAYPGICLSDNNCWGNPRGQIWQWFQTSDTSGRAQELYGEKPEPWIFETQPAADLVLIHLGTNDNNTHNMVATADYVTSYLDFVAKIHAVWPAAQIVLVSLPNGFGAIGNSYYEVGAFRDEIFGVYNRLRGEGADYVHYFNNTGVMQHNDISPQWHPTDAGQIKTASHIMQFIRMTFGWDFASTGPEVYHETLYWNDEPNY